MLSVERRSLLVHVGTPFEGESEEKNWTNGVRSTAERFHVPHTERLDVNQVEDTAGKPTFRGRRSHACPVTNGKMVSGPVYGTAGVAGALLALCQGRYVRREYFARPWGIFQAGTWMQCTLVDVSPCPFRI